MNKIAEECCVCRDTIDYWMNKHKIEKRSKSEVSKLNAKRGKDHPFWIDGKSSCCGYILVKTPGHPRCNKFNYVY